METEAVRPASSGYSLMMMKMMMQASFWS